MNNLYVAPRKKTYCLNCGRPNHEQNHCMDPITSWGIILIKTSADNKFYHYKTNLAQYKDLDGIRIYDKNGLFDASRLMNSIKFLLVQRKHSLGFFDFVRGRYKHDNLEGLLGLMSQMTPNELEIIKNAGSFLELWETLWGNDVNKKGYDESEASYNKLRARDLYPLDEILKIVTPNHTDLEWGFPKGRKKQGESDVQCALREFKEETNINPENIKLIESVQPIEEILVGTNGIRYKHVYYLAELNNENALDCDDYQKMNNAEIGASGFFNYFDSIKKIRDYHVEKRSILTCIINYYVDLINDKHSIKNENDWIDNDNN